VAPADCCVTEVNGDSKSTYERGPYFGSLGLSCRYNSLLSCLGCSGLPVQNNFFLAIHYFNFCVPIAQQHGKAVVQGRLSLNVCLRAHAPHLPSVSSLFLISKNLWSQLNKFKQTRVVEKKYCYVLGRKPSFTNSMHMHYRAL
jgi:hypothetical protein